MYVHAIVPISSILQFSPLDVMAVRTFGIKAAAFLFHKKPAPLPPT